MSWPKLLPFLLIPKFHRMLFQKVISFREQALNSVHSLKLSAQFVIRNGSSVKWYMTSRQACIYVVPHLLIWRNYSVGGEAHKTSVAAWNILPLTYRIVLKQRWNSDMLFDLTIRNSPFIPSTSFACEVHTFSCISEVEPFNLHQFWSAITDIFCCISLWLIYLWVINHFQILPIPK